MDTIVNIQRTTLEKLTKAQFKEFKYHLGDLSRIPWHNLEKGDPEDILDLLAKAYSVNDSDRVILTIFKRMNLNQLGRAMENKLAEYCQGHGRKKCLSSSQLKEVNQKKGGFMKDSRNLRQLAMDLKNELGASELVFSDIQKEKEEQLFKSFANLNLDEGPKKCLTTHEDVGPSASCECLEPLLREEENGELKYMLRCHTAGLFECKFTGLRFKMETPGEVEYYSVPWGIKLEEHGPAGPLYNINCLRGTLVQLYLPHCEITSDGKHWHLHVAHITHSGLEIITPKAITESHVIIDITCLSRFGLITRLIDYVLGRNIQALVLLFLQTSCKPELNVLLLSKNTDLEKVKQKKKNETYIQRNPNCKINTRRYYSLSTDQPGPIVTPERAQYVEDSQNFFPAFTVPCRKVNEIKLILKDEANTVWSSSVTVEEKDTSSGKEHGSKPSIRKDFFSKSKGALETRLPTALLPILNQLEQKNVLNTIERDEIQSKTTPTKKNECLLGILHKRGAKAQEIFYQVLQVEDPLLVEDLENEDCISQE